MYYYDEVLDNSHVNVSHTTFLHDSIPIAANVYLDPNKEKPAAGYTPSSSAIRREASKNRQPVSMP